MAKEKQYITGADGNSVRIGVYMGSGLKKLIVISLIALAVFIGYHVKTGADPAETIRDVKKAWTESAEDMESTGECSKCGKRRILTDGTCISCEFKSLVDSGKRAGKNAGAGPVLIVSIVYGVPILLLFVILIGSFCVDGHYIRQDSGGREFIYNIWRTPIIIFLSSLLIAVLFSIWVLL